jgi:hypothetical protein
MKIEYVALEFQGSYMAGSFCHLEEEQAGVFDRLQMIR